MRVRSLRRSAHVRTKCGINDRSLQEVLLGLVAKECRKARASYPTAVEA
jgi:hypothetical protein